MSSNQDMQLSKTWLTFVVKDLSPSCKIYGRSGMMQNGIAYQLPPLALRTDATGFGLLPTPRATDGRSAGPGTKDASIIRRAQSGFGLNLAEMTQALERKLWTTPSASDASRGGTITANMTGTSLAQQVKTPQYWPTPCASDQKWRYSTQEAAERRLKSGKQMPLEAAVHLWPTPVARDFRSPGRSRMDRTGSKAGDCLPQVVGGALNPTWVEWLMGFPLGWTVSKAWETR